MSNKKGKSRLEMEKEKLLEKGSPRKHWIEVNGQLHDPVAISPGKEPPIPIV
jgi:hypothetical protein